MTAVERPILLDRDGGVAWLRLNRPAVLNAVDTAMSEAFLDACRQIAGDRTVRTVVIVGQGRGFMAGGDVACFTGEDGAATIDSIIRPLHEGILILRALPLPVLASLHGPVAGAGMSLALACDLAIAADNARFTLAYSRIGTSPDGSSTFFLPRLVGLRKAMELALLAETIDAAEALRLGLVNKVVPSETIGAETEALAHRLANGPTAAYGRIKALFDRSLDATLADQLEAERLSFQACATTEDFAEGVQAFLDKRAAVFHGR